MSSHLNEVLSLHVVFIINIRGGLNYYHIVYTIKALISLKLALVNVAMEILSNNAQELSFIKNI